MPENQSRPERSSLEEIRATRLEKVEQLNQAGLNPYCYRWELTHHAAELQEKFADLPKDEEVPVEVVLAGRIMARRVFGKLAFLPYKTRPVRFSSTWSCKKFGLAWQRLTLMPSITSSS